MEENEKEAFDRWKFGQNHWKSINAEDLVYGPPPKLSPIERMNKHYNNTFIPTVIDPKMIDEIKEDFNLFSMMPKVPWKRGGWFARRKSGIERMRDRYRKNKDE